MQGKDAQKGRKPTAESLQSEVRSRGRPAAASREDVLDAGLHRYLRGQRVDVQAIASELGLGRATIYRWFGSREKLLGEVIINATEPVLAKARSGLAGKGGPGLLDTFDRFNRALADAPALSAFVEQDSISSACRIGPARRSLSMKSVKSIPSSAGVVAANGSTSRA